MKQILRPVILIHFLILLGLLQNGSAETNHPSLPEINSIWKGAMKGKNGVESKVEGKVIASQGDEFTMRAKLETGATLDWIFKFDRDGRLRTKEVKRVSFMRGRKQGYNTAGLSAFGEIDGDKVYWNSKWELRKKTLRQKYTLSKVN